MSKLSFLIEGELTKASVILAVKSINDKLQTMAENLAKMEANDIMPILDNMVDAFGSEFTTQFNDATTDKIRGMIESIKDTKEVFASYMMKMEGNEGGNDMSVDDFTDSLPGDDDDAAGNDMADDSGEDDTAASDSALDLSDDSAAAPADTAAEPEHTQAPTTDQNPMGRARKESVERNIKALRESSNPDRLVYETFLKLNKSLKNMGKSAILVAEAFNIEVDDVAEIVKEGKTWGGDDENNTRKKFADREAEAKAKRKKKDDALFGKDEVEEGKSWRSDDENDTRKKFAARDDAAKAKAKKKDDRLSGKDELEESKKKSEVSEKFDMKPTSDAKKGMFDGWTQEKLRSEEAKVKKEMKAHEDKGEKVPDALRSRFSQLTFALRAKHNWGSVDEGKSWGADDENNTRKKFASREDAAKEKAKKKDERLSGKDEISESIHFADKISDPNAKHITIHSGKGIFNVVFNDIDGKQEVSFFDAHQSPARFTKYGQFVSSYNVSTILGHGARGLDLHGGVDAWKVDAHAMGEVCAWLERLSQSHVAEGKSWGADDENDTRKKFASREDAAKAKAKKKDERLSGKDELEEEDKTGSMSPLSRPAKRKTAKELTDITMNMSKNTKVKEDKDHGAEADRYERLAKEARSQLNGEHPVSANTPEYYDGMAKKHRALAAKIQEAFGKRGIAEPEQHQTPAGVVPAKHIYKSYIDVPSKDKAEHLAYADFRKHVGKTVEALYVFGIMGIGEAKQFNSKNGKPFLVRVMNNSDLLNKWENDVLLPRWRVEIINGQGIIPSNVKTGVIDAPQYRFQGMSRQELDRDDTPFT